MSEADLRVVPEEQRRAVVAALRDMSARPSSAARAGRVLGITQQGVHLAVTTLKVGHGLRDKVIEYLARRSVLRDASVSGLLEVYGPAPKGDAWTWKKLLETADPYPERQIAKRVAYKAGVPVDAAARVCTRPPWTAYAFAHRSVAWWAEEMKGVAKDEATSKPLPREKLAELVKEDYELLQHAG